MSILRLRKIATLSLCATVLVSASGCALFKKKPKYAGSDGDFVNGTPLPERQEGVDFLSNNVEKGRFTAVHFGYDSYTIAPSENAKIGEVAEFVKGSSKQLVIAGFTDERGTAEYNRGLGERRAQAVRAALLSKGADSERIQTTSFGSEMAVDAGHSESAWAKNRRAEFGVTK
ncbi:MAG: OmpA family protein [Verrucomicrobiota bacterium]